MPQGDNMLEVLLAGGVDLFRAVRMMIPPAWQNVDSMDSELRAFYEYNSMHMEPWDGPAGVVMTDGRQAVCMLDRNGLRPARWVITKNGYITLASEIGTYGYKPEDVVAKGRVGPGQMLAVDTQTGEVLHTQDIDDRLKSAYPYKRWLKQEANYLESALPDHGHIPAPSNVAAAAGLSRARLKCSMFFDFFEDVSSGIAGQEFVRGFPGFRGFRGNGGRKRSSEPPFHTRRGSG